MDWIEPGFGALFILSFAAATLLPLGSEWLLILMLTKGFSPITSLIVATAGNTLGSYVNYFLGYWAHDWLEEKRSQPNRSWQRAERWFQKYGVWSLLLAWVPVVGDPLTFIAGILKAPWLRALLLILVSKLGRYGMIVATFVWLEH